MEKVHKLTIFFLLLYFSCSNNHKEVLAEINGDIISLSGFKNKYQDFLLQKYQNDNLSNRYLYLNNLIDEKLILNYAKENELENDSVYIKKTKEVYDQLLLNNYFDKKINVELPVTELESRNIFKWKKTSFHVRHLFSKDKEKIQNLKSRLDDGENWSSLARDCFQDTLLKKNGGDLGWYEQGELDPVFEWRAFTLTPGTISDPVKTRDGYSIIHLIETEYDGFMTEDEYQKERLKLIDLVRNYKQQTRLLHFTDSTVLNMNIEFSSSGLENLHSFLLSLSNKNFEIIKNQSLIVFEDEEWNIEETLYKLSNLSSDQLSKIINVYDLKQAVIGLVCRSKFLVDAVDNKIHLTSSFKKKLSEKLDQTMIKKVVKNLNQKFNNDIENNQDEIIKNYFNFRKKLVLASDIKVDTLLIKKFIM